MWDSYDIDFHLKRMEKKYVLFLRKPLASDVHKLD